VGTFFGALLLVTFLSISTVTGISTNANATSTNLNTSEAIVNPEPDCVCAERKGWLFGKCKGLTVRVCEGDLGCDETCGD
tara:strand:- start:732 stop:971 length:240 start_codon:yes stop_codon:yes gene_type:complete